LFIQFTINVKFNHINQARTTILAKETAHAAIHSNIFYNIIKPEQHNKKSLKNTEMVA